MSHRNILSCEGTIPQLESNPSFWNRFANRAFSMFSCGRVSSLLGFSIFHCGCIVFLFVSNHLVFYFLLQTRKPKAQKSSPPPWI